MILILVIENKIIFEIMIKIFIIPVFIIFLILILFIPPLNKIILFNFLGYFLGFFIGIIKFFIRYTKEDKIVGIYPISPKKMLMKYKMNFEMMNLPMPIWREMKMDDRIISVQHGTNFFSIPMKNIIGKSRFLDPDDIEHYHLWYGIYFLPLDYIYEIKNNKKYKFERYGYNYSEKNINIDEVFLIIQYDYYNFFRFRHMKYYKENKNKFLEEYRFNNINLKSRESENCDFCWEVEGSVYGKNLLLYSEKCLNLLAQSLTTGWIPKSSEDNLKNSKFKGKMSITYRDSKGNIVNPESESAKILCAGYVFGIHWDNGNRETPDNIINELFSTFTELKYIKIKSK